MLSPRQHHSVTNKYIKLQDHQRLNNEQRTTTTDNIMKPAQLITSMLALALVAIANPVAEPDAQSEAGILANPAGDLIKRKVTCGSLGTKKKPAICMCPGKECPSGYVSKLWDSGCPSVKSGKDYRCCV